MTYSEASAALGAICGGVATVYLLLRSWALVKGLVMSWVN